MNWEAIGAVGEIVGALAVVATLAYLATQIRQNTIASRAATMQHTLDTAAAFSLELAKDPNLWALFGRGMRGEALSPEEQPRLGAVLLALMRNNENMHYQSTIGLLDPAQWDALTASLKKRVLVRPGFRDWWAGNHDAVRPEFRAFVDSVLER